MDRFRRSWQLLVTSLAVMRRDTRLLLFPVITAVLTVFITLLFICPMALRPTGHSYLSGAHWKTVANTMFVVSDSRTTHHAEVVDTSGSQSGTTSFNLKSVRPLGVAYFALLYFVSMFCATFFNVAFYHEILAALNGQPVSIAGGLRFALSKWEAILTWTLFAGIVGYIIKALEERFGLVGRLIMRLIGTAWSIACVFVIPVLITDETTNPLEVLRRSALTLKRTWGESLIGYAGVSLGGLMITLASIVWLGGALAFSLTWKLYWLAILAGLAWLVAIVLWSYVLSVASQIFRCALFLYASQGSLPEPYTQEMMALAWKQKKR